MFNQLPAAIALCASLLLPMSAPAQTRFQSPEVLILGDSQLSFGAGAAFLDFFGSMAAKDLFDHPPSVAVIGVRSSSLAAFTARGAAGKSAVCDVDPKWRVNAGSYGVLNRSGNPYIQIGRGSAYQFCQTGISPFEAMFRDGYYHPRLLVLFFLGNATDRWAAHPDAAMADVRLAMRDLPLDVPCIFMTTAPTYGAKIVALRQKAQANAARAFAGVGRRCIFVAGYTEATIAANRGNAANFRRNAAGRVKDPFHPTEAAARRFLNLRRDELLAAIRTALAQSRPVHDPVSCATAGNAGASRAKCHW